MRRFYAEDPAVREVPGAAATFAALRRAGVKTALNTGFGREVLDGLLARLGWSGDPPAVDAVVASDEVPRGRPHPDMIRSLMAQLGVRDAARVAKVGDTPADLEEGANAGCGLVVGVTNGAFPRAALERMPHTFLIDSIADLPAVLRNRGDIG
jgi:phosphonatase-like hydrolase